MGKCQSKRATEDDRDKMFGEKTNEDSEYVLCKYLYSE